MAVSKKAFAIGFAAGLAIEHAWRRRVVYNEQLKLATMPVGRVETIPGPDETELFLQYFGPEPDGTRPVVVLSHGWTCTSEVWREQVAALHHDVSIVTYDQPGHGRSTPPTLRGYDLDLFGEALADVLQHLRKTTRGGPVVVVGHSLGGMAIINHVKRYGSGHLAGALLLSTASRSILESYTRGYELPLDLVENAASWLVERYSGVVKNLYMRFYTSGTGFSFLTTRFVSLQRDADPALVNFNEQMLFDSDLDMLAGTVAPLLCLDQKDGEDLLPDATTIVAGLRDTLTPPVLSRRLAGRAGIERLIELPKVGHMTPLEAPGEVNSLILWHASVASGGPAVVAAAEHQAEAG